MATSPTQQGTALVFGTDGRLKQTGYLVQSAEIDDTPNVVERIANELGSTVSVVMAGFDTRCTAEFIPHSGTSLVEAGDVITNGASAHSTEKWLVISARGNYSNTGVLRVQLQLEKYEGVTLS